MFITTRRSIKRLAVPAMLGASLLAFVTGCAAPATSTPPTSSSTSSSSSADDPDKDFLQWQLKFAECMRGQGQNVSDPEPDGSVTMEMPEDAAAYEAATATCTEEVGAPPAQTGGAKDNVDEDMLKAAQCLRDAGYDVPDPTGGGLGLPSGVTDEALEACDLGSGS